ncbi:receptor-type tyrosine-protein phosphatase kappa-like protein [Leptotrombidium deliense]|uniref:Receptor-type tyrosine-protein phosphatase kappa-like protein n=1 Tax=Leptotrombidium deliense TaxID=299467 RepID=A0A443SHB8_9ACAR|nr:receptor-type tyrosine-protein phosphatase kappa-like protein [Leptotrombidium deliense]
MSKAPKLDYQHRSQSVPPTTKRINALCTSNVRSQSRTSINTLNFFLNLKTCKGNASQCETPTELSPVTKFQLSLLNSGCISIGDSSFKSVSRLFSENPTDFRSFAKYLQIQKKYNVLLKIEFNSLLKPNAYIAAQGPNDETIADFWRMIWKEKSYVIIMLTKVFDFIRVLCSQYWPLEVNKSEVYGSIEVTLLEEDVLADFVIRTFRLRKTDYKKEVNREQNDEEEATAATTTSENIGDAFGDEDYERIVFQFHYFQWPTHTCPFVNSLLHFRRRIRVYVNEISAERTMGPIVVHCSDGCGRTGTFICIDANLELGDEDNMYDVFGYTKKMKQARKGMIETVFVYDCLEEAYLSGKTWFPVDELMQQMKYKSAKNPLTRQNEYQREYQKIQKMTPKLSIGECAGGHRIENRDKNRDVAIVPPDNHRPYLTSFQSNDSTDYINAVFVDGYTRSREYIVTEWPLTHTFADFWSLVYDHDCNSIILLANPDDQTTYPIFWPLEKEKRRKYGPVFSVELVSFNHYPNVKSWIFKVSKKVVSLQELMSGVKGIPKTTQLFQITCWPLAHKVPTSTNALVELMNMVERWRQRSTYGPVCVISTNGRSRVGVYCAANVAIEQVVHHGEVDVFHAVKTVRRHRRQMIENMTEYKYCYDLILHYFIHYLNK